MSVLSRRNLLGLGAVALVLLALFLSSTSGGSAGSTLSYGALGWRGLAAALEELAAARMLARWPEEGQPLALDENEMLVIAFPWLRQSESHYRQISEFVREGGQLTVAYDGRSPGPAEERLFEELGLETESLDAPSSLLPWRWRQEQRQSSHAFRDGTSRSLTTARLRYVVRPPSSPQTRIVVGSDSEPVLSTFPLGRGSVRLLPASALANAFLHQPGNSELLADWIDEGPRTWVFDELHHGFGEMAVADSEASRFLDRMVLQLLGLYVAALIAFAWRFGPTWRERAPAFDSHREFLVGIGELHGRLGHEPEAARLLAERTVRYAPSRFTAQDLEELEQTAARGNLLAVARRARLDQRTHGERQR
ncbi:MAG: DUF4350 domain-containing protein [Acidobacteriota bacterium]